MSQSSFPSELIAMCLAESERSIMIKPTPERADWYNEMIERLWYLKCQKECPALFPHLIPGTPYLIIHTFLVRSRALMKSGRARLTRTVSSLFVAYNISLFRDTPPIHISLTLGYINDPCPGRIALYLFAGTDECYRTAIEEIEGYYVTDDQQIFSANRAPRILRLEGFEEKIVHDAQTVSKSRIYRDVSGAQMTEVLRVALSCGFYPLPHTRIAP